MNNTFKQQDPTRRPGILFIIAAVGGLAAAALAAYGPIAQDPSYHEFADHRELFGIPNFWNVFTNIPFVVLGLAGLYRCREKHACAGEANSRLSHSILFTGVLLTGLGSAYYHLQPDNWGLFWDRLAMALTFMAFLSILIAEYAGRLLGKQLLAPLVLFGIFSVVYWIGTEIHGSGDLRLYVLTQFLPMVIIPVILVFRRSTTIRTRDILVIGAYYALAKLFEFFDAQIYLLSSVGGHSLKHLAAAFSVFWILRMLRGGRKNITENPVIHQAGGKHDEQYGYQSE